MAPQIGDELFEHQIAPGDTATFEFEDGAETTFRLSGERWINPRDGFLYVGREIVRRGDESEEGSRFISARRGFHPPAIPGARHIENDRDLRAGDTVVLWTGDPVIHGHGPAPLHTYWCEVITDGVGDLAYARWVLFDQHGFGLGRSFQYGLRP